MSTGVREREEAELMAEVRALKGCDFDVDVERGVVARLAERKRTSARARWTWRFFFGAGLGLCGAGALALAILGAPSGPEHGSPMRPAKGAVGGASQEAGGAVTSGAAPPLAVVIGPEPLLVVGVGPVRSFAAGESIPPAIAVRTPSDQGAGIRIGGRADVRLDPGAEVAIDPASETEGFALLGGRIHAKVQRAPRSLRVRLPEAAVEIGADEAAFGLLLAGGPRWSAAVHSGEVRVRVEGARDAVHAASGTLVGGRPGRTIETRPIPSELTLALDVVRSKQGWVVRGLTDLLARVEADGREVAIDAAGQFTLERSGDARSVRLTAVDCTGRSRTHEVQAPSSRPSPRGAPALPAPPSPNPAPGPAKRGRVEFGTPEW